MSTNPVMKVNDRERSLQLSYSQIFTYLGCSLKYRFQYVEKRQPERQSISLLFGRAFHDAIERFYLKVKTRGDYDRLNTLTGYFENVLRLALDESEVPVFYKKETPDADSAVSLGKSLIETFYERVNLDGYQIVDAELPLTAELYDANGSSTGFKLYGILDLLLFDENRQRLVVVDTKTAAKPKSQSNVDEDLQFSSYAYLLAANKFSSRTDTVNCRMDVLRKLKTPKMEYYWTQRTAEDRKRFAKIASGVLNGIDNQVFIPNRSWLCSDCQYTEACRSW